MSNRPSIPAEIKRQILIGAGHRCAVCGDSCPLERAHIVSYCASHDNSPENLICLCANCHARADKEQWGERILREYKRLPWVQRKYTLSQGYHPLEKTKLQIVVAMEVEQFDGRKQRMLEHAVAGFLELPPHYVRVILKVISRSEGSTIVEIELPRDDGQRLLQAYQNRDLHFEKLTTLLRILDVRQDLSEGTKAYPDLGKVFHQLGTLITTSLVTKEENNSEVAFSAAVNNMLLEMCKIVGCEAGSIFLISATNDKLCTLANVGYETNTSGLTYDLDKKDRGITAYVASTGKAEWFNNNIEVKAHQAWRGKFDSTQWTKGRAFRNCYVLPLKVGSEVVGVL